jgi:hypothetical protein
MNQEAKERESFQKMLSATIGEARLAHKSLYNLYRGENLIHIDTSNNKMSIEVFRHKSDLYRSRASELEQPGFGDLFECDRLTTVQR